MGLDIKSLPKPVKAFFNGIGQVVFIENSISGMIIFASFLIAGLEMNHWAWGDFVSWKYFIYTLIGVNVSNLTAYLMGCDRDAITSGLFGFCPNLVAIAAGVFPATWTAQWVVLFVGCILVVPTQIVINKLTNRLGLPGFTFPFIVMTWFFILIGFQTNLFDYGSRAAAIAPFTGPSGWPAFDWLSCWTKGFEEIYVLDGVISSFVVLAAYFWYKWDFALKACLAVAFSVGAGFVCGVDMTLLSAGLYSYSAILVVGGLDTFCKTKINSGRYWFLFFLSLTFCVLINMAIPTILTPFALPNCTLAFVVSGWIILLIDQFMCDQAEKRALKNN